MKTHKWHLTGGSTAFHRWRWECGDCGLVVWKSVDKRHPLGLNCRAPRAVSDTSEEAK